MNTPEQNKEGRHPHPRTCPTTTDTPRLLRIISSAFKLLVPNSGENKGGAGPQRCSENSGKIHKAGSVAPASTPERREASLVRQELDTSTNQEQQVIQNAVGILVSKSSVMTWKTYKPMEPWMFRQETPSLRRSDTTAKVYRTQRTDKGLGGGSEQYGEKMEELEYNTGRVLPCIPCIMRVR